MNMLLFSISMSKKVTTSWGGVADWYSEYLTLEDSYQAKVILPNVVRLLEPLAGRKLIDVACGEGYFSRAFAKAGAKVVGADIAPELIAKAKEAGGGVQYYVAPAEKLQFATTAQFDIAVCVLALQNIDDIGKVFKEVHRVLKPKGTFVFVLNHPAFRVLKRSSWVYDEGHHQQYRRIDGYLSSAKITVDMHPGKRGRSKTVSYHRSIQDFSKALFNAGFTIDRIEEWTSHKTSEKGPRQKAEDTARKEIPLFMALQASLR